MIRILLLGLLFYFLFRFILRYVLPIWRITSAAKKQMRDMQGAHQEPAQPKPARKGDYIEFEEVKQ
ncbi:MAG: hypothetical protein JST06_04615 [Bacteroidetes bacterium]|nr:hypothetical protein [Bacteroidota bacterium]MBS1628854.1 hypothetical protein [Bacteroidota bacterium]